MVVRSAPAPRTVVVVSMTRSPWAPSTASADPLAALETEAKANPKDAGAWQRLGFAMFDQGRFADSAAAFEKAVALSPKHAVLWSSLGEALVMASEQDPMPPRAREGWNGTVGVGVAKTENGSDLRH